MGSRKLCSPPKKIKKTQKFLYNEGFIEDFETDVTIISLIALSILLQKNTYR